MSYIRDAPDGSIQSIKFLTPCHATPFYSHTHKNIPMSFLDCSPQLGTSSKLTENDRFFDNPLQYLENDYQLHGVQHVPSHYILFEPVLESIVSFLEHKLHYHQCASFFHTFTPLDNKQGRVLVYCNSTTTTAAA